MSNITVQGYNASNKVPGFYGRSIFASGSVSGQLFGLVCLVMAQSSGTATPDTGIYPINSQDDVTNLAGNQSIGGAMLAGALANSGVSLLYAAPAAAGGAVAASMVYNFSGTWSTYGTFNFRVCGVSLQYIVQAADTPSTVAANIALLVNGEANMPINASSNAGALTFTVVSPGVSGDQWLSYTDTSLCPSGFALSTSGAAWAATTVYAAGTFIVPDSPNGFYYKATSVSGSGTSGGSQPTFPTTVGMTVIDNTGANQITWTCWGKITNGNGLTFGGGAGTPNYANVIAALSQGAVQYDMIAPAENDATNLGLLNTFVNGQMAPTIGILNSVIFGTSQITSTQAQQLSSTTLNNPAFQQLYAPNSEIHPAVLAASHAARRSINESGNPNPRYLNDPIVGSVPQASKLDWVSNTLGNALLGAGVTPCTTLKGGTELVVMRGITTYCLTPGGSPDSRVLDVNEFTMARYGRMDLANLWETDISPNYEECQDDPPPEGPDPAPKVLYPHLLNSILTNRQIGWEQQGWTTAGSSALYPTVVQFNSSTRSFFFDLTIVPTPGLYIAAGNIRQRPV